MSLPMTDASIRSITVCSIRIERPHQSASVLCGIAPLGHHVRLIAPQFVKPFLKSNKNDYLDAAAIAEAV